MSTQIPIPDLRFESSFYRSLQSSARSKNGAKSQATPTTYSQSIPSEPVPITPTIIIQVILKDVILMPLLQGIAWTSILLVAKPWLLYVAKNGRDYGVRLFNSLGFQQKRIR